MNLILPRRSLISALACCSFLTAAGATALSAPEVVTGEIVVAIGDDFSRHTRATLFYLHAAESGKTFELTFPAGSVPRFHSGDRVRMTLRPDGNRAAVQSWATLPAAKADALDVAPAVVSGGLRSVVLIVNFLDSAVLCTKSEIASSMFTSATSVDSLYREMSYSLVSFPGDTNQDGQPDVFGPFTINATTAGTCSDVQMWANAADAAAQAAGVNLAPYGFKIYVVPSNTACSFGGLGEFGDTGQITPTSCYPGHQCRSWIFACGFPYVFAHELGHNLGLNHAASDSNNDGHLDEEYGDTSDLMGSGGFVQLNGPHKIEAGWIPPSHLLDVGASGVFTLAATETNPASTPQLQILRIFGFYQISYRKPTGYDNNLGAPFPNSTSIHRHSFLTDLTWNPPYDISGFRDLTTSPLWVSTVADGQSFTDPANGLTVKQLSHTADQATVQVTLASPSRQFHTITPCRWIDTRTMFGVPRPLYPDQESLYKVAGHCGIPATARALSANVTVTGATDTGFITFYPAHLAGSNTSTLNFTAGQTRSNNAVLPLSAEGLQNLGVKPFMLGTGELHLIIDLNGYFK